MRRWLLVILVTLPLLLLLLLAGGFWWLTQADLRPLAERVASDALGRSVRASHLEIGWGDPLILTLRDLRIANAPWGSEPDMISLRTLEAAIDPASLWEGRPIYRRLHAAGLKVVLERDEAGTGNWKFGGGGSDAGGLAIIPKNRTQFPTLIDMALKDALITYRTYSGNVLRIQLDDVMIASPGEDTPVTLEAQGAYNDTPLSLSAKTGTFRELRDASQPFPTDFTLAGRTARIDFSGTMMEPLDFEGVAGRMKLEAQELDNLAASFGADISAAYPLVLEGDLKRQGDHWDLDKALGQLAGLSFTGELALDEGRRGSPDHVAVDLSFEQLALDKILPKGEGAPTSDWRGIAIAAPQDVGMTLDAKLAAKGVSYGKIKIADFSGRGRLRPGEIAVEKVSVGIGGGTVSLDAQMEPAHLVADVVARAIDADRLARELGAAGGDMTGKLDGALHIDLRGATLAEGLAQGRGVLVAGMQGGSIRENMIELASTDLRALFREESGQAPIRCFGLRAALADGQIHLGPLQLQAEGATLDGAGRIDAETLAIDLRVESRRESSGFFALDLPIHVAGTLDNLSAGIAEKGTKPVDLPKAPSNDLTGPMHDLMGGNACLR